MKFSLKKNWCYICVYVICSTNIQMLTKLNKFWYQMQIGFLQLETMQSC